MTLAGEASVLERVFLTMLESCRSGGVGDDAKLNATLAELHHWQGLHKECQRCDKPEPAPKQFRLCSRCRVVVYCCRGETCVLVKQLLRSADEPGCRMPSG